jgi:hypothetical protein
MSSSAITQEIDKRDEHGFTALYFAAKNGDAAEVERLLVAGANPSLSDRSSVTALHVASTLEVVRCWSIMALISMRLIIFGTMYYISLDLSIELEKYGSVERRFNINAAMGRTLCVEFLCFKGANVNHRDMNGYVCFTLSELEPRVEFSMAIVLVGRRSSLSSKRAIRDVVEILRLMTLFCKKKKKIFNACEF